MLSTPLCVFVCVLLQGHAVLLFKRMQPEEDSPIRLFTTRRINRPWQRKVKPVRDSAGQVIPGKYA